MEADGDPRAGRAAKARKSAIEFLELREAFGDSESAGRPEWPELEPAAVESVMATIRRSDPPRRGRPRLAAASGKPRAWRLAALASAAVLIASASSALTYRLIQSSRTVEVRFVLAAPEASSVRLAADFNHWSADGYELEKAGDGTWSIVVPLRKGKTYAYNFIIDGERWVADPSATMLLDDGFGGSSSSLTL